MAWSLDSNYNTRPVVVLGGGVLGRRIAACFVSAGWHVIVRDPSEKSRNDALAYIHDNIATYTALSHGQEGKCTATDDLQEAVKDAWLVFEAVPEVLSIKESTFVDLEKHAPKDCIFASNSSSYKTSELVGKIQDETKQRVLNTHFMMPPQALIVELMTSGSTADRIFPLLEEELSKAGLHPVTALKESTGFIFNRIWAAIKREVLAVIQEGVASPETIDSIWKEQYGSPIGPCTMMGVGLDTVSHIETHYVKDRHLPSTTLDWLNKQYVDAGKLGNKSDKGGLYPPPSQGHGTKILVLNMYQGSYPGELSPQEVLNGGQILAVNISNKQAKATAIVTGEQMPDGIDVHGNRMYWTCMGMPSENTGAVYSAKLDGSDRRTVIPAGKIHTPKQLHIHSDNKIYICDREGLRIHRCNFDGSSHSILVQTGDWQTEPSKKADGRFWPVGITVSAKLNKIFWTQKGGSKGGQGRILSAPLELPKGTTAADRDDIETVASNLPEPIDLEFDDDNGILYWTDRGEIPLGNTLNKKTLIPQAPEAEKALGREIIALGFGEAIGLRLDKARQKIYVADICGRLWECGTSPGPKAKIHEEAGHAYTGLAFVKY